MLSLLVLLTSHAAQAKIYLVSVGISDYPGVINDLNLPERDAKTITALYKVNSQITFCQLFNHEATVKKIKAAMKIFENASPDDTLVFYYSGHGYPGGLAVYDGMMPYSEIRSAMSKSKSKKKMIFADACFVGGLGTTTPQEYQSEMDAAKKANVMLFLASRDDEVSYERYDMQNGYFTHYLQQGLRGAADTNKDRIISAQELFVYVHKNVIKLSDNHQHPIMWGNFSDKMPIMQWSNE